MLKAGDAKDRRKVEQPISLALADDIRPWLAEKPPGCPVPPLHHETAKMIRRDLEGAGVAYETEAGFADFHSLRGSSISALVGSGADIETIQTLARHKRPVTTLTHSAKSNPEDIRGAVQSLPNSSDGPSGAASGAGGLVGELISDLLATQLPRASDATGHLLSLPGEKAGLGMKPGNKEKPTEPPVLKGFRRLLSSSDVNSAERGGFEPPIPLSQYNGLANRDPNSTTSISANDLRHDSPSLAVHLPFEAVPTPPDLAFVVERWPSLAPAVRAGIVAMIRACGGEGDA